MKLELNRKEFLKSWQLVESFEDTKNPNGVLVRASENGSVILKATDLKMSVSCIAEGVNVLEVGSKVIPASILGTMLRKSASDELLLSVDEAKGFLKSGNNRTRFNVISVENFPKIPESKNAKEMCEISAEILTKMVSEATSAASLPADFPKYMGTCNLRFQDNLVEAASTDGKRLAVSKCECVTQANEELLVLASNLSKVSKLCSSDMVKIFADDATVWFACGYYEFALRRIDSAFPKYEKLINDETKTVLRVSIKELLKVIDRIDIIAGTTPFHLMILQIDPSGELKISAKAPETGIASETLSANVEGEFLQVGFNVKFFVDGLKALGADEALIEFSGDETQTRMKHENFLYMVMPTRLSEQDKIIDEE